MTDEELIARLNNLFWILEEEGHYTKANTARFAADRIQAKAAEIERLRGERDEFEAMAIRAATIAQEQRARAEKGLKRAEILVEAWYRCDDASFRHLMEEMRADVEEAEFARIIEKRGSGDA